MQTVSYSFIQKMKDVCDISFMAIGSNVRQKTVNTSLKYIMRIRLVSGLEA